MILLVNKVLKFFFDHSIQSSILVGKYFKEPIGMLFLFLDSEKIIGPVIFGITNVILPFVPLVPTSKKDFPYLWQMSFII